MEAIYVGKRKTCGHIVCAIVDDPKLPKETARFLSDAAKRGFSIHRLSTEAEQEAAKDQWCWSSCPQSPHFVAQNTLPI